jgi:hypothetical protein
MRVIRHDPRDEGASLTSGADIRGSSAQIKRQYQEFVRQAELKAAKKRERQRRKAEKKNTPPQGAVNRGEKHTDEFLIEHLVALTRKLGRWPSWREWRTEKLGNAEFPGDAIIRKRLGAPREAAWRVYEYCKARDGYGDVLALVIRGFS